ncbi:hypothetical protein GC173_17300 [bacterium]|nr:hypothetical protein [bacterium]
MKPNLLIQVALVALSLILLLVAVLLPPKTREVPTTISMEVGGERVVLSTSVRQRPSEPKSEGEPEATPAAEPESADPATEQTTEPTPVPAETNLK